MKQPEENLIQLVYCSSAKSHFSRDELRNLLAVSRKRNSKSGITGMLLYAGGSFLQVLEGEKKEIDNLIASIEKDERHDSITSIIREPIAERSFSDWTMGYADISQEEVEDILGTSDFLQTEKSLAELGQGRARKLLDSFKKGYWRNKISGGKKEEISQRIYRPTENFTPACTQKPSKESGYSYAFQPIVNPAEGSIYSYEALLRGADNEPAAEVFKNVSQSGIYDFDEKSRLKAIHWAGHLGLQTHVDLNILPSTVLTSPSILPSILEAVEKYHIEPRQIILEILESEFIDDLKQLSARLREFRSSGILFAIDDFGAGHAGLNLLAEFQPDVLKLDLQLVRDIDRKGPRQAIVRGIRQTCMELGIEVIAEGVETKEEYLWLRNEGIELFQGYLFSKPAFEELPVSFTAPC